MQKSANSALVREQSPHRPMQEISLPPQNDAEYVKCVNVWYGKPQTCDQKKYRAPDHRKCGNEKMKDAITYMEEVTNRLK